MAVSEQARRRLHEALEAQLGEEDAATLMGSLPPAGWGDVATKHDLEHLHVLVKKDVEHVYDKTQRDLTALRHELRGELQGGLASVRGEMREMSAALRGEMQAMRGDFQVELRKQFAMLVSTMLAAGGLFLAAARVF